MARDWHEWHRGYDQPDSPLSRRLRVVQEKIGDALDVAPKGEIRVLSFAAGEARDLLGVLDEHPRRDDVTGRLVELDPELAAIARERAPAGLDVFVGDAGVTASYADAVPADLVLVCGVFGNVTDDDMWHAIERLPMLCAPGATVIWTRHRRAPDLTPRVRAAFTAAGFEELDFVAPEGTMFGVGVGQFTGTTLPFADERLFDFVGYDVLEGGCPQCGFSYHVGREAVTPWLRSDAAAFVERFRAIDANAVRQRPEPDVWSPLEYACHVRDVLRVQRERVLQALAEDEPAFAPMRRDERVIEEHYNEQDPAVVAQEILEAATAFADLMDSLDDAGWSRRGVYNYPEPRLRTTEWIAIHTTHELLHHRVDIGTLA
jgi:DinB superfamily